MKIVVTGGAGFIGSHIAEGLAAKGHEVTVFDDLSTGYRKNLEGIKCSFIEGSINDLDSLKRTFKGKDCVYHEAALASVSRSVADPIKSNTVNVDGTLNVLEAARCSGVRKVIFASSSSVYGDTLELPKHEGMKPLPKSPYAVHKLVCEHYLRVYHELFGLETLSIRYFNVFGERQDPNSEYAAVIPIFLKKLLAGEAPIIFGDGGQTRDFTYVKNVVHANILALDRKLSGEAVNVATGKSIDLLGLLAKLQALTGRRMKPIFREARAGDVRDSLADIKEARKLLSYEPVFDFDAGIKRTVEYFKKVL